jgi:epoxyqueuosine reductase
VLHSYLTDAPLEEGAWGEPVMMDQCEHCNACVKACPTGAISGERFLINAERCLTAYTESDKGFPEWVDPNWQKSLLGCFACQQACPANQAFLGRVEFEIEFSEEDTRALLEKLPMEKLSEQTAGKIKQLGFDPFVGIFSANLKNLIERAQ